MDIKNYQGGLVIQWVNATAPMDASGGIVALPMTFPNAIYAAFVVNCMGSDLAPTSMGWRTDTTTNSAIGWRSLSSSGVGTFVILAIGA